MTDKKPREFAQQMFSTPPDTLSIELKLDRVIELLEQLLEKANGCCETCLYESKRGYEDPCDVCNDNFNRWRRK
jgi:hypothetical protein